MCQKDYTINSRNGKHRITIKKRKEGRTILNRPEEADDRSKLGH